MPHGEGDGQQNEHNEAELARCIEEIAQVPREQGWVEDDVCRGKRVRSDPVLDA